MTTVTPKPKPLALKLPTLPPAGTERVAILDAIAATIATTFGPQVARFVAARLDERADVLETGEFRDAP
jgi:hypothetical protein